MSHCVCGHPEEAHLFGGRCRVPGCVCDRFWPIPEISAQMWCRLMRTRGDSARRGDGDHKRISVPGASTFSQQRPTSFAHYASAWRTANTGSNPERDLAYRRVSFGRLPDLPALRGVGHGRHVDRQTQDWSSKRDSAYRRVTLRPLPDSPPLRGAGPFRVTGSDFRNGATASNAGTSRKARAM